MAPGVLVGKFQGAPVALFHLVCKEANDRVTNQNARSDRILAAVEVMELKTEVEKAVVRLL